MPDSSAGTTGCCWSQLTFGENYGERLRLLPATSEELSCLCNHTCRRKGTDNGVHFLQKKAELERGVATARSEVAAEPVLEPRLLNSPPELFLTPEPQRVAGVSETRLSPPGAAATRTPG